MREYARELRDMRDRVRERPYLFEQVKQVIGSVVASLSKWRVPRELMFFFSSAETREGSGRAGVQEQTEEKRDNRALHSTTRRRKWRRVVVLQVERQCRWEQLWLQQVCNMRIFSHVLHVMPQSGKNMNSTGDGEPRTLCGLVILHYIILWAYAAVFSEDKRCSQLKVRCNYTLAIS